jgi:hypothetical protein
LKLVGFRPGSGVQGAVNKTADLPLSLHGRPTISAASDMVYHPLLFLNRQQVKNEV